MSNTTSDEKYHALLASLKAQEDKIDLNTQHISDEYAALLDTWMQDYAYQHCLHPQYVQRYLQKVTQSQMTKYDEAQIESTLAVMDKTMAFLHNQSSVALWSNYLNFFANIEELVPSDKLASHEQKSRQVSDRAIESVGTSHFHCESIWKQYIDTETCRNNLAYVNLLGYMSLEVPMNDHEEVVQKYVGLINSLYDGLFEESMKLLQQPDHKYFNKLKGIRK